MTTMLEKAAKALAYSLANTGVRVDLGEGITTSHIFLAEDPTAAVLAVLKAIREPDEAMMNAAAETPGMKAAGSAMQLHQARGYGFDPAAFNDGSPLEQAWRAAIDTITTEGTGE